MTFNRKERLDFCLDGFLSVSNSLVKEFEGGNSIVAIPLVVNAAFATELALKRWIELHNGRPAKRAHHLNQLWADLSQPTKDKVIPLVCAKLSIPESRFNEYLDKCSATFVDWRYMYERDENFTNYLFLVNLANCVAENT